MTTTSALGEAVRRDAAVLLESYRAGDWVPEAAERELAQGLARSRWDAHVLRAALRKVIPGGRDGRLANVLAPAADVIDCAGSRGLEASAKVYRKFFATYM